MLNRILRKRTQLEIDAFQAVRDLMPRNRKSKGIQYETLEFLFQHLYERVSEEDLAAYLVEVKGHLQRTGDPVKGAINQAVKELQRLSERSFEIIKIQESTPRGARRLIQMNYTHFEDVIGMDVFLDYLRHVLNNEADLMVRGVSRFTAQSPNQLFPGITYEDLSNCRAQFLVGPAAQLPAHEHLNFKFIAPSVANIHFLLVYENKEQPQPFLGFIAKSDLSEDRDQEFLLYRGGEKAAKLKFLDRIWENLYQHALDPAQLQALKDKAAALTQKFGAEDVYNQLLNGLIIETCDKTAKNHKT